MISVQTALLRLALALVLGALIGLERERDEKAAGLRTHALVALGSCLVMIVSAFGFADILGTRDVVLDPSRIAAQVVSGIGFLGAGTILLRKEIIRGLTTAAAIWVVAAIGLSCGAGLLIEAVLTTLLTVIVLALLQPLRQRLRRRSPVARHLRVKVTVADDALLNRVYDTCAEMGASIENIEVQAGNGREKMEIACSLVEASRLARSLIALRVLPGVESIVVNLNDPTSGMIPFPFADSEEQATEESTPL
jgi:putative Mg2+ transporter-C (MgtC) family protein